MIVRKFEVRENQEYGGLGFAPSWIPDSDPYAGMAVPHDILEHMPNEKFGAVEGEFMALGAMYLIRGETGWFNRKDLYKNNETAIALNMSSDIPDIMYRVLDGTQTFKRPSKTNRLDDYIEDDFKQIIKFGMREIAYREDYEHTTRNIIGKLKSMNVEESMLGWMRKGYRSAVKRYKGYHAFDLSYLFTDIMEKVEKIHKYAEEYQILTVRIDLDRMNNTVSLDYPAHYFE